MPSVSHTSGRLTGHIGRNERIPLATEDERGLFDRCEPVAAVESQNELERAHDVGGVGRPRFDEPIVWSMGG